MAKGFNWPLSANRLLGCGLFVAVFVCNATAVQNAPTHEDVASIGQCADFFSYTCRMGHGAPSFPQELLEHNNGVVRDLFESPRRSHELFSTNVAATFYYSCISGTGDRMPDAVRDELQSISVVSTRSELTSEVARLHALGVQAVFRFGKVSDPDRPETSNAGLEQGGLGLPSRSH